MIEYVRVTLKMMDGSKRRVWAQPKGDKKARIRRFDVVDVEGGTTDVIILAENAMVLDEKPATMNLHYGKLEISKEI